MNLFEYIREQVLKQQRTSAKTSLNQVSAAIKKLAATKFKEGQKITDVGGGKYDKGIEHIKHHSGADAKVFDPYNRNKEHNDKVITDHLGKSDHVMSNNVGNVIEHDEHLHAHLQDCKNFMHPEHGEFHMSIYDGNRSGKGGESQGGESWQRNSKLSDYVPHVKKVFPESEYDHSIKNGIISVKRKGK